MAGVKTWMILTVCLGTTMTFCMASFETYTFIDYKATPSGCESSFPVKSHSWCAVSCLDKPQCHAFKFQEDEQTCKLCYGENISDLTFSNETFYFKRTQWMQNQDTSSMSIQLTRTLSPGDLIYVSRTITNDLGYSIDLQDQPKTNVLHVYVKLKEGVILLNTNNNGVWKGKREFKEPFPFAKGDKTTNLFILATQVGFKIYVDTEFCCFYEYVLPLADVKKIKMTKWGRVHEMSY